MGEISRRVFPHPVHRLMRKHRVARAIRRFPPRTHEGTYGGHALTIRLEDPLAEGWYGHDWPVLPEIEALRPRLPGATVFDLGAHQAVVALMLAREVGPTGKVLAVEGEPHNTWIAQQNVDLNGAENLTVLGAAVDREEGEVPFAESLNGSVDTSTRLGNVMVQARTIDGLAHSFGIPDVVFIDIEGYEGRALWGAEKVIASAPRSLSRSIPTGSSVPAPKRLLIFSPGASA